MKQTSNRPQGMTGFIMTALEITFEILLVCVGTHMSLIFVPLLEPLVTTGPSLQKYIRFLSEKHFECHSIPITAIFRGIVFIPVLHKIITIIEGTAALDIITMI